MRQTISFDSDFWEHINNSTGTDILNIVMDLAEGRTNASQAMELIAARCEASAREGAKLGVRTDA